MDVVIQASWQQIFFPSWNGISVFTWDPTSPNTTNLAIDDMVYNAGQVAVIPLPATLPLLAISLAGLFGIRRKRG